jgi:hypothetical protein
MDDVSQQDVATLFLLATQFTYKTPSLKPIHLHNSYL